MEPFAGGGIVSLTVAAEDLAEHMTMVELDEQVAAVWHTIINNDEGNWLAEQIMSFDISSLTPDDVRKMTETNGSVRTEKGLRRGGIQRL